MDRPPMRTVQTPEEVVDTALAWTQTRQEHTSFQAGPTYLMVEAERFVPRRWSLKWRAKHCVHVSKSDPEFQSEDL